MSADVIGKNVKSFIIKSVQCIVESRLGGPRVRTVGKPIGNEWFYIALNEYPDVNEMTKRCLQAIVAEGGDTSVNLQLIKSDWKICCEILLKTNDGESVTLEYWLIENQSLMNEKLIGSSAPLSGGFVSAAGSGAQSYRCSSLFHSYNQMSILLKSIISLSRATPAYKITENQSADSYVICYRVYKCDRTFEQLLAQSGDRDEASCFSGPHRVGSVRSDYNVLNVSLSYRTNMQKNTHRSRSASVAMIGNHNFGTLDHGLLNDCRPGTSPPSLQLKSDHFTPEKKNERKRDRPLFAAFATTPSESISFPQLIDDAFNTLLPSKRQEEFTMDSKFGDLALDSPVTAKHSEPIQIPESRVGQKRVGQQQPAQQSPAQTHATKLTSHLSGSPGCSSLDSFVFVDLKPPFAPDDQSELGSFFNGPSPSFGENSLAEEMEDLSSQLALMESSAQQWDQFVDSINLKDAEDEGEKE